MSDEKPWLRIIGIGEDGLDGLSRTARELLADSEILIGGARHLALIPEDGRARIEWPSPLQSFTDKLLELRGRKTAVLATGDPMQYGIGATFAKVLPIEEMIVVPNPSAFSLAAARLGWALAEVRCLTVHGRPLSLLAAALQPGAKLLLLSEGRETPGQVAAFLTGAGFGKSRITVLEHMGGPKEARLDGVAESWEHAPGADFNTIALQLSRPDRLVALGSTPGFDDDLFASDGQLTKREVRAATLAALRPGPGQLLWDIGAGSGSVSIEWLRGDPLARAIAIEPRADRIENIRKNADRFGTPFLKIIEGEAPDALDGLELPDAIFIGGGISSPGLLEICWNALKPGGRLVANVVTVEGETELVTARERIGGSLTRIAITRAEPVGLYLGWRPLMPVTQWVYQKSGAGEVE